MEERLVEAAGVGSPGAGEHEGAILRQHGIVGIEDQIDSTHELRRPKLRF